MILPPLIYESSISLLKSRGVFYRIGSLLFSQHISIIVCTGVIFVLGCSLIKQDKINYQILFQIALIAQLNDYVSTLEPPVLMAIDQISLTNQVKEETIGYLGLSQLLKNSCLIFALVNIMPETML